MMKEVKMSLGEIREYFGEEIADECDEMSHMEVREFHTATYEGIVVRCEICFWTNYYVKGELLLELALELEEKHRLEESMGMGM